MTKWHVYVEETTEFRYEVEAATKEEAAKMYEEDKAGAPTSSSYIGARVVAVIDEEQFVKEEA